jgi:hypothetical protein
MGPKVKTTFFSGDTARTGHRGPESPSRQIKPCLHCVVLLRVSSSIETINETPFNAIEETAGSPMYIGPSTGLSCRKGYGSRVALRPETMTLSNVC